MIKFLIATLLIIAAAIGATFLFLDPNGLVTLTYHEGSMSIVSSGVSNEISNEAPSGVAAESFAEVPNEISIQFPLWMGVAGLLVLMIVIPLLWSIVVYIFRLPHRLHKWHVVNQKIQEQEKTLEGVQEMLMGNFRGAERKLRKGTEQGLHTEVSYLALAWMAEQDKKPEARDEYLEKIASQIKRQH